MNRSVQRWGIGAGLIVGAGVAAAMFAPSALADVDLPGENSVTFVNSDLYVAYTDVLQAAQDYDTEGVSQQATVLTQDAQDILDINAEQLQMSSFDQWLLNGDDGGILNAANQVLSLDVSYFEVAHAFSWSDWVNDWNNDDLTLATAINSAVDYDNFLGF